MKVIDVRGLSCPEPLVAVRNEMVKEENFYQIFADSIPAKENISRYARNRGYVVSVTKEKNEYMLLVQRKN